MSFRFSADRSLFLPTAFDPGMRQLIAARSWLTVFQLPAYAPELNPVEAVWSNLKRSLANLTKQGIDQLVVLVKTRLRRMQYRPGLIDGFLAKTGLDLNPIASRPATTGLPPLTVPMAKDTLRSAAAAPADGLSSPMMLQW